MSAPEKPKERSFPKIEFTDSEAGALDFPSSKSRSYSYFKPAKLRATMYEDVTVDVQPDPDAAPVAGLGLRLRRRTRWLPAGLDRGEIRELARVP